MPSMHRKDKTDHLEQHAWMSMTLNWQQEESNEINGIMSQCKFKTLRNLYEFILKDAYVSMYVNICVQEGCILAA